MAETKKPEAKRRGQGQKWLFTLIFPVVLSAIAAASILGGGLQFFEQKLLDFRFQVANPGLKPSQDVVFIDINDESLAALSKDFGSWPWPRGDLISNMIVDYVMQGEPAAFLFDILYPEYSPKKPGQGLPEQDQIMVMDSLTWPNLSHAVLFQTDKAVKSSLPPGADSIFAIPLQLGPDQLRLPQGINPLVPFRELGENAASLHVVNEAQDSDGTSRRYTLVMESDGKFYPSLALKGLMFHEGYTAMRMDQGQLELLLPSGGIKTVPLLDDGRMQLLYYPDLDQFNRFPAYAVIQSAQAVAQNDPANPPLIAPGEFKGKIVVLGASAAGLKDFKVTPMGPNYAGPYLHLTAVSNILGGHFLHPLPAWATILSIIASLLLILLVTLWLPQPLLRYLLGILWLMALILAGFLLFKYQLLLVDMANTVVASLLGLIGAIIYLSMTEGAEKRYIRGAFSTYLSPDVIKQLEADPNKLMLGGEKREMTAMFTDVRGFSTFSEKLDPNDLVKLLNEYLGAMSDVVLDNQGTIDKYEGDAIIAFWGAPLDQADHARKAVLSAIQMRRIEQSLNERLIAEGIAPDPLLTRIGINSGDMTVGNMGTRRRMNYTIMGNSVNLAARLEGVNKQYGTWILASQHTRNLAGDGFLFRGLDQVRVVGIKTPVRLYEVIEERSVAGDAMIRLVELFEDAISHYEKREWNACLTRLEEVLAIRPDDGPAKVFIERARAYRDAPPPDSWDGVFGLNSK